MPFDADWLDWFLEICFIPRTRKTNDQICLLPVACYYTRRHWVRRHCGKPPIPKMMPPCISLCMAFYGTGLLRLVLSWNAPTTSSAFCNYTNNCNKKNKILLWLYFLIDLPECELSYFWLEQLSILLPTPTFRCVFHIGLLEAHLSTSLLLSGVLL